MNKLGKRLLAVLAIAALVALFSTFSGGSAGADHAGETVTVSKTSGLEDGDAVQVSFTNMDPAGMPVKIVIAGQGKLTTIPDKLNFAEYASAPQVTPAADGTGSTELIVVADHGEVNDGTTLDCLTQPCWVIAVQEPFLPQPNYASVPITFAGGVGDDGAAATTAAPEATTTTAAAATTTEAEATTTTEVEATTTTEATDDEEDADDDGGSNVALFAIIAAVVALVGGGGFLATRRKGAIDE